MFKKFIHIIISILLIVSTTGVTISKHYSGGEVYSFSITGDAKSCCENNCECCQNSVDTYRLTADYLASTSPYQDNITVIDHSDIIKEIEQDIYHTIQYRPVSIPHYKPNLFKPDLLVWKQSFLL